MSIVPIENFETVICQITRNVKLKFKVRFGKANFKKERMDALYSHTYSTDLYNETMDVATLYLDKSEYLVIDYKEKDDSSSIYISYPHMFNMERIIKDSLEWFYSEEYEDMFIETKKHELKFNAKYKGISNYTNLTIGEKSVAFKPAIVEKKDLVTEGVIMILEDKYAIPMDINDLESLYYNITHFNLATNSYIITNMLYSTHPEQMLESLSANLSTKSEKIPKTDEFRKVRKKKKKKKE